MLNDNSLLTYIMISIARIVINMSMCRRDRCHFLSLKEHTFMKVSY